MRDVIGEIKFYRAGQQDSRRWWQFWKKPNPNDGLLYKQIFNAGAEYSIPFYEGIVSSGATLYGFKYTPIIKSLAEHQQEMVDAQAELERSVKGSGNRHSF